MLLELIDPLLNLNRSTAWQPHSDIPIISKLCEHSTHETNRWTRDKPMSLSFDKERWAYTPELPYLIPPTCRTNESLKCEICLFWINNTSQNGWLQQSFHWKIYASTLLCAIDTMGLGAMDMEREYLKLLDGTILRAQLHTCHTWRGLRDISYSTMRLVTQRSQVV